MKRALLSLLLLLTVSAQGNSLPPLQPGDVFSLQWATSPIVSDAGDQIFYLRNSMDIMQDQRRANLWRVNADGSGHVPVTTGARNVSSPALSPDGKRIAFVDEDDSGSQVFVRWLEGGQTAQLTRNAETPKQLTWSPDGRWIAFSMRVPVDAPTMGSLPDAPQGAEWSPPPVVVDRLVYRNDGAGNRPEAFYQLFVVPAEGGAARQLTGGRYDHDGAIAWTGDSSALLFSANRNDDWAMDVVNSDIYRVALSGGPVEQVTSGAGPEAGLVVSPDGRLVAYTGYVDNMQSYQRSRLYLMNVDGSDVREILADLDRSIENPQWSEDGRRIFFQFDDRGETVLAVTDLRGRMERLASGLSGTSLSRPYTGAAYDVGGGDRYAFTIGNALRPADLATARRGDEPQYLTSLNPVLAQRELARVEKFTVESPVGGESIDAWLALPPGFSEQGSYPLVLEIHGGPHTAYGPHFSAEVQLYAAAGYAVLYVNPRGSTSYGERFANLIHHNYPNEDFDDLMAAVDAVIERGYIDADRLYVTGGSGGGVLTAWIVGNTDRFQAAVVAKPVINWTSFVLTADNAPYFSRYWFPGMPWDAQENYWKRSPLSLVGNVTTPTMLLTGESDYRTPMSETEQYYAALKLRGIDTAMVRIPGASHSIAKRPTQLMAKVAAILEWFSRYPTDS